MSIAVIFPGQGSQIVGMGHDFFKNFTAARHVFQEVNDTLHIPLSQLIFEGPPEDLTLTHNTQPALMTVSIAIARTIEQELGIKLSALAQFMAGHSLGEYTALAAAHALTLEKTASLLRLRGEAMQAAVSPEKGAMAALIGGTLEQAEALAASAQLGEVCCVANDNSTEQQVISGHIEAISRAIEAAPSSGFKRAVLLPVSAPFHSPLMEPAAHVMKTALEETIWSKSDVPLIANITAALTQAADTFAPLLVAQVTGRVRWRETLLKLQSLGVTTLLEIGAGKVLSGLARRTVPDLKTLSVSTVEDFVAFQGAFTKNL